METMKKVLGAEHPDTLISMANLAHTLRAQGDNQSAYALMDECASISHRILGPNHPYTVDRENMAKDWNGSES
jgi:5,10-methylenetetrahydrofolate reductase